MATFREKKIHIYLTASGEGRSTQAVSLTPFSQFFYAFTKSPFCRNDCSKSLQHHQCTHAHVSKTIKLYNEIFQNVP